MAAFPYGAQSGIPALSMEAIVTALKDLTERVEQPIVMAKDKTLQSYVSEKVIVRDSTYVTFSSVEHFIPGAAVHRIGLVVPCAHSKLNIYG